MHQYLMKKAIFSVGPNIQVNNFQKVYAYIIKALNENTAVLQNLSNFSIKV